VIENVYALQEVTNTITDSCEIRTDPWKRNKKKLIYAAFFFVTFLLPFLS